MGLDANQRPRTMGITRNATIAIVLLGLFAFLFVRTRRANPTDVQAGRAMELKSTGFSDGAGIPARYTCDGDGVSPSLDWSGAPAATKSFALIVHDPDAPVDFTHWLAWDIPADVHRLPEGASNQGTMPHGSAQGMNGFRTIGYGGPCPPGGKPHHYIFLLYALDSNLGLPAGSLREQLESAMRSHIVATGRLVGTYGRNR
jgi:Raf kinase inhibitor-like YbhB/YbcL family protein